MKIKYLVLSLILSYSFLYSIGQNNLKDLINNNYNIGDTITIKLDNSGGIIQWQESIDIVVWTDIFGQTQDSLIYIVDSEKYIRASVNHSNCNPYYSDTLLITLQPICPATVTDYDGNSYNTILIGTQCWMAENLKTTHYPNGDTIPNITDDNAWASLADNNTDDAYCYYDNSSTNANIYGALYTWAAAMGDNAVSSCANPSGVQGVCPTGWHLPSDNEWKQLEMQLGMSQSEADATGYRGTNQGSKLAGSTLWYNGSLENNAQFDSSGFSALPGGWRNNGSGFFEYLRGQGTWWSSTETINSYAFFHYLYYYNSLVGRNYGFKSKGHSVRCVKAIETVQVISPTVITYNIISISDSSAIGGGEVTNSGGTTVTTRGVCWNTTGSPTIANSFTSDGTCTGIFTSNIDSLSVNTTFYVRAYAINSVDTAYGNEITFTTLDTISVTCPTTVSDYDGNIYNTVSIGTQCWMAENLKTTHYPNGDTIPHISVNSAWQALLDNNSDDAYCCYDNSSLNANTYGALYSWAAAMGDNAVSSSSNPSGVQGACPTGWHLPSDNEWKQLEMQLGMSQIQADQSSWRGTDQGCQLAGDSSLWDSGYLLINAQFGTSGFLGLPGGFRNNPDGASLGLGIYGRWWSSTEYYGPYAWARYLNNYFLGVCRPYRFKSDGFSVRCLKD